MKAVVVASPLAAVVALLACAPARPPVPVTGPYAHIAAIHRARCGACHRRVEPGQRTRAQLETALARHHDRVHLDDEEWSELVDYLASNPPSTANSN